VRGWLSRGADAARVAMDRSDLWLPGAVVAFAGAGWIVLLLTVAPEPGTGDAASFGLRMAASPWWPWNLVVLTLAILSGLLTLLVGIAFGEVAILLGLSDPAVPMLPRTVPRAMAVLLGVALPVIALVLLVLWAIGPDLVDAVAGERLLATGWPLLVLLGAIVVVAQAFGAVGLRLRGRAAVAAFRGRWARLVPQAAVTFVAFLAGQLLTATLLGLLWQPLAVRLADDGPAQLTTVFLLLGFVWIWLVLVVLAGIGQAWTSAWWSAELAAEERA
jgi:hypothetical protein